MNQINDINNFIKDYSGTLPNSPDIDVFKDMRIRGDDFHEMIDKYAEKYQVDLSDYLWYFHTNEEGQNFGGIFFKPPYAKVERIPVTPQMLLRFAETKKWKLNYPDHTIPKQRFDILINQVLAIIVLSGIVIWGIWRLIE